MKKLIAMMMCAMLLLSGCAAVTADGPGVGLQLRDLVSQDGDGRTTDLTGLAVSLETAQMDQASGLRLSLNADSGAEAHLAAAVAGQYLIFTLQSAGGTSVYALDMIRLMEELSGPLSGVESEDGADEAEPELTDQELEALIAQWEDSEAEWEGSDEAEPAGDDPSGTEDFAPEAENDEAYASLPESSGEDDRDQQARLDRALEIIGQCAAEGQQQIGGETYQTMELHIGSADMTELLNATDFLAIGDIYFPLGDVLAAGGLSFTFDGSLAYSDDGVRYLLSLSPSVTTREEDTYALDISVDMTGGDGGALVSGAVTKNGSESQGAASFAVNTFAADSADWLPLELGPDAVIIDSLHSPEASQAITDGFTAFLGDVETLAEDVLASNAA